MIVKGYRIVCCVTCSIVALVAMSAPGVVSAAAKGKVFTSLFSDATVFRDRVRNGLVDGTEKRTTTLSDGRFVPPKGKGRLLLVGGTEISTGKANVQTLVVPSEARAASTLTALWQALLDRGSNRAKNGKLLDLPGKTSIRELKAVPIQATAPGSKQELLLRRDAEFDVLVSFSKSLSGARLGIAASSRRLAQGLEGTGAQEDPDIGALAQALLGLQQRVPDITNLDTVRRLFVSVFDRLGVSVSESNLDVIVRAATDIIDQIESSRASFEKLQRIRANAVNVIASGNYSVLSARYTGDGLMQQILGDLYDPDTKVTPSPTPSPTPTPTPTPTPVSSPTPTPSALPALNDTGIVGCSDGVSNDLPCPVAGLTGQDAEFGRDVSANDDSDGHAGFAFTKVGADGSALATGASTWTCIKDNVTGLIWEVKTNDSGLRDVGNTYTNYSLAYDPNLQRGSANDAAGYVAAVNRVGLCGATDWRLPDVEELESLLDLSVVSPGPSIDSRFFGSTLTESAYWTSEGFGTPDSFAWGVRFDEGSIATASRAALQPIRLVRSGP